MNIRELASLTGVAERQIRYMIAEGFVPPPTGGRAHASYGDDHVRAIRRYLALKEQGFLPAAIRVILAGERETVPFSIHPGLTLQVDPALLGDLDVDALVEGIRLWVADFKKEPPHDQRRRRPKPR